MAALSPAHYSAVDLEMDERQPEQRQSHSLSPDTEIRKQQKPETRSRNVFRKLPVVSWWIIALIINGVIIGLVVAADLHLRSQLDQSICAPNGKLDTRHVSGQGSSYGPFSFSLFFDITIASGSLSFTAVKVIDIVWDIVIGRGVQVMLTYIAYRVFAKALLQTMETDTVSPRFFSGISFAAANFSTFFTALGELRRTRGRHRVMAWRVWGIALCILYVASFPTLLSAMTGYKTKYSGFVRDYNGTLIPWARFQASGRQVMYSIADGGRIGLQPNGVYNSSTNRNLTNALSAYYDAYPLNSDTVHDSSIWTGVANHSKPLQPPPLNITFLDSYWNVNAANYNLSYIAGPAGNCYPADQYQWGFSFLVLFFVMLFQVLWTLIMFLLWLDAERNSRAARDPQMKLGTYRAAWHLTQAMTDAFGTSQLSDVSNEEMAATLKQENMEISAQELPPSRAEERRQGRGPRQRKPWQPALPSWFKGRRLKGEDSSTLQLPSHDQLGSTATAYA